MAAKKLDAGLQSELCAYYEWGLSVLIDEKLYDGRELNQACSVLEEDDYMRDYGEGQEGEVTSVNFTKVTLEEH